MSIYRFIVFYLILIVVGAIVSRHMQYIISLGLIYGMVAMGLVILIGYGGLVSFGQAAYYAIGAYTVGLLIKYAKIQNVEILMLAGIATSTLAALAIGVLAVRTRKIAFAMITLAFTMIIYAILIKFYHFTGGTDGLRIPIVKLAGLLPVRGRELPISNEYLFVATVFILILYLTARVAGSPFSLTLRALKDSETKAVSLGISPSRAYLLAFTYAGFLAGTAGTLYAFLNAHIEPTIAYWTVSSEFVFITILGGTSSIAGVIIASVTYIFLKSYLIAYTAYYWQFMIGILLLLIIFVTPKGLSLIPEKLIQAIYKLRQPR